MPLKFVIRSSCTPVLDFPVEQTSQEDGINPTVEANLTIDGHHGHLVAELNRQFLFAVEIHDFQSEMIALLLLLKEPLGFFAQMASLASEQDEMKMLQAASSKEGAQETEQGATLFSLYRNFLRGH